jgi:hypothetical protein
VSSTELRKWIVVVHERYKKKTKALLSNQRRGVGIMEAKIPKVKVTEANEV